MIKRCLSELEGWEIQKNAFQFALSVIKCALVGIKSHRQAKG